MSGVGLLSFEETYAACRTGVVGTVVDVDVVRVTGKDARSYLQTQCSQDLAPLGSGDSIDSLILSPQGKVDAFVRIALLDEEEMLVVVAAGYGDIVHERLRRFRLRVKAELEQVRWRSAMLRGPLADDGGAAGEPAAILRVDWHGMTGVDLIGPDVGLGADVPEGDPLAFEAVRIEAGEPVMGREITERTIAQEAGLVGRAVSLTKGCYPGQELVARIDARGDNVPKRLRGIVAPTEPGAVPALAVRSGAVIRVEEREVGTLTSVAWSPQLRAVVALGYVRRDVVPPAQAMLGVEGAEPIGAEVVELPIV